MKETLIQTKDIAAEFVFASKKKDLALLKSLLSEDGVFEIQNKKLEIVEGNKKQFLKWYESKLAKAEIESNEYDQCLLCLFGKQVILFNNGKFPRAVKDSSERAKTGLALEIKDYKIDHIRFCFTFLKAENKNVFQATGEKIGKYIEDGLPRKEAIAKGIEDESKEFNLVLGKSKFLITKGTQLGKNEEIQSTRFDKRSSH